MTKWDDISFIARNKNRKRVSKVLEKPKTPTDISKELDLNIGYVSNILIELLDRKFVKCLSPNEKRHRFYRITPKGKLILKEAEELYKVKKR